MSIYVFLGPTLTRAAARGRLDAVYLPPVSQGDILRLLHRGPSAIGIVDGRFHDVPAVWHKEIMWAMSRGVPVYGSASMGALRAAELAAYGMRGVGWIFQSYMDGSLTDDDEVAVAHGDAASGYLNTSEAMVNIRRTIGVAVRQAVVSQPTAQTLIELAKATFYPQRSYPGLLATARDRGLPEAELDALSSWLPGQSVNQKAADALEMLDAMRGEPEPARITWSFQHSVFFERAKQEAGGWSSVTAPDEPERAETVTANELLCELRLDPTGYRRLCERAALRAVVGSSAQATQAEAATVAAQRFRRERGLLSTEQIRAWLTRNELTTAQFADLVTVEDLVARTTQTVGEQRPQHLLDQLRIDGNYPELTGRVTRKRRLLSEHGLEDAPADAGAEVADAAQRWYFARLGAPIPNVLREHWEPLGYPDESSFVREIRREYWYQTLLDKGKETAQ